ncbi:MAG: ribosome biogenesis GTPase Der [Bacteroidales bacterium]|nr:ribosome biogenesis GTPase Der [Bacteroidales bacterium]
MIVAIVGRPNVGKSTLFNRLTETKHAIIDETAGVTRDRIYGKAEWIGKTFSVVDTGGYVRNSDDIFEEEIRKQVDIAIEEANLILFVVDVENGVTDLDDSVAQILRRSKKDVILVTNKVDNNARIIESNVFYKFGLGDPMCISSINGSGTGELLDKIVSYIKEEEADEELDIPKYTVIGRPNVGKSSLINALIGEERNIVTPISGTTRDSINTRYNKFNQDFYLVDTAGIRKKAKVKEDLEFYSVLRSIRALEEADVCLLMLDAENGIESQDLNIISLIQKNNKGIVILVNKWDLIDKDTNTAKDFTEKIKSRIAPFTDVPIIFTSVLTKQRIHKVLEEAKTVYENRRKKIPTAKLNEVMQEAIAQHSPPSTKGKFIKIKYITQLSTYYPSFVFFCNLPQYVKDPYKRYLENKLREHFGFTGSPVTVYMRKK